MFSFCHFVRFTEHNKHYELCLVLAAELCHKEKKKKVAIAAAKSPERLSFSFKRAILKIAYELDLTS